MNEVAKVVASQASIKLMPDAAKGQKTGNSLPADDKAAINQHAQQVSAPVSQENVQAAVAKMNEYIQSTQRDLSFTYDPGSGETIVKVLDRKTQEVIRQIPDEIFLRLAEQHNADTPIQLFSAKV